MIQLKKIICTLLNSKSRSEERQGEDMAKFLRSSVTLEKDGEVFVKDTTLVSCILIEKKFGLELPEEVKEKLDQERRVLEHSGRSSSSGELGKFSWRVKNQTEVFTLGKGTGGSGNMGSRHYKRFPDEDPRNDDIPENMTYIS